MLVIGSSSVKLKPYQDESEVGALTKHPGVGGEHQVSGQRLERLAPNLETKIIKYKKYKIQIRV